jgi:hypothetical protein
MPNMSLRYGTIITLEPYVGTEILIKFSCFADATERQYEIAVWNVETHHKVREEL